MRGPTAYLLLQREQGDKLLPPLPQKIAFTENSKSKVSLEILIETNVHRPTVVYEK